MNKRYFQSGVSLVELLVSIVIGLVVISGVVSVVATSRTAFVNEQESSFMQENLRYAIELMSRDIRASGDRGCAVKNASWYVSSIQDSTGLFGVQGVEGYEWTASKGAGPTVLDEAQAGSDAIIIRYVDNSESVVVTQHTNSSNNTFTTASAHGFSAGEKLFVVDSSCRHYAYFESETVAGTSVTQTSGPDTSCTDALYAQSSNYVCPSSSPNTATYREGSVMMPYRSSAYFIDDSDLVPGISALKRRTFTSDGRQRTEELAQGIESMEIMYGVDSSVAAGELAENIDQFVDAQSVTDSGDWDNVLAVRITFGLRSLSQFYDEDVAGRVMNGVAQPNDRFLRSYANVVVLVRNGG